MTATLSSKGQIVVPSAYRRRLGLREGMRFHCQLKAGSLVFTPEGGITAAPRLVLDGKTGLWITKGPPGAPRVTSEQVRAAMEDFP